jgi:hypothetical protein
LADGDIAATAQGDGVTGFGFETIGGKAFCWRARGDLNPNTRKALPIVAIAATTIGKKRVGLQLSALVER